MILFLQMWIQWTLIWLLTIAQLSLVTATMTATNQSLLHDLQPKVLSFSLFSLACKPQTNYESKQNVVGTCRLQWIQQENRLSVTVRLCVCVIEISSPSLSFQAAEVWTQQEPAIMLRLTVTMLQNLVYIFVTVHLWPTGRLKPQADSPKSEDVLRPAIGIFQQCFVFDFIQRIENNLQNKLPLWYQMCNCPKGVKWLLLSSWACLIIIVSQMWSCFQIKSSKTAEGTQEVQKKSIRPAPCTSLWRFALKRLSSFSKWLH